jgi:hypothetical protein
MVVQVHHVNSRGRTSTIISLAIYVPNHLASGLHPKAIRDTFGVQNAHSRNLSIRATNLVVVRGTPTYSTRPLYDPLPHFVFEGVDRYLPWDLTVKTILEICGYSNVTMIVRQRLREQRSMFGHAPRQPSVTVTTRRIETFALVQERLSLLSIPGSEHPVIASIRPNAFLAPYVHIFQFDTRGKGATPRAPLPNSYLAAVSGQTTPSSLTLVSSSSSTHSSQALTISSASSSTQSSQELTIHIQDQLNDLFTKKLAPIVTDLNAKNNTLTSEITSLKNQLASSSLLFNTRLDESTVAARSESSAIMKMLADITANMVRTNPPLATPRPLAPLGDISWKVMMNDVLKHPSDEHAIEVYERWFRNTTHMKSPELHNPIFRHRLKRQKYANGTCSLLELGSNDGGAGTLTEGWAALRNVDPNWLKSSAAGFESAEDFLTTKGYNLQTRFPGFGILEC